MYRDLLDLDCVILTDLYQAIMELCVQEEAATQSIPLDIGQSLFEPEFVPSVQPLAKGYLALTSPTHLLLSIANRPNLHLTTTASIVSGIFANQLDDEGVLFQIGFVSSSFSIHSIEVMIRPGENSWSLGNTLMHSIHSDDTPLKLAYFVSSNQLVCISEDQTIRIHSWSSKSK